MVLGEEHRRKIAFGDPLRANQFLLYQLLEKQLLLQPDRHRGQERPDAPGREAKIGLNQTLEFQQRLVIERDVTEFREREACFAQTVRDGVAGEARIVLLAGETLLSLIHISEPTRQAEISYAV